MGKKIANNLIVLKFKINFKFKKKFKEVDNKIYFNYKYCILLKNDFHQLFTILTINEM